MIIKKWSGSAWVSQSAKTTFSDIVVDVTATSPVSIFESGKLKEAFLPNSVFDSLYFFGSVGVNSNTKNLGLQAVAHALTQNRSPIGYYWVVTANSATLTGGTGAVTVSGVVADLAEFNPGEEGNDSTFNETLEVGDWFILTNLTGAGTSQSPYRFTFAAVNNTYELANANTHGIVKLGHAGDTNNKRYKIETTTAGLYVDVPWVNTTFSAGDGLSLTGTTFANTAPDQTVVLTGSGATSISGNYPNFTISSTDSNTEYDTATANVEGLIALSSDTAQTVAAQGVSTNTGRTYGIQLASGSNQAVVNVPWINTEYNLATETVAGLVEIAHSKITTATTTQSATTNTNRFYGVRLNAANQMIVNVPWANDNTLFTAGSGISLTGTQFNVAGGVGLTQEASGLKMDYPIIIQSGTPSAAYQVLDNLWFHI